MPRSLDIGVVKTKNADEHMTVNRVSQVKEKGYLPSTNTAIMKIKRAPIRLALLIAGKNTSPAVGNSLSGVEMSETSRLAKSSTTRDFSMSSSPGTVILFASVMM